MMWMEINGANFGLILKVVFEMEQELNGVTLEFQPTALMTGPWNKLKAQEMLKIFLEHQGKFYSDFKMNLPFLENMK